MGCAVYFNLDNTLTSMNRDFSEIYREAVERAGIEELNDSYEDYKSRFFKYFQNGWAFPRRQAMDQLCRDKGCYDPDRVEKFVDEWEELESDSLELKPGVNEALKALSKRDFSLGILSNGTERLQNMKLKKLGIDGYFDAVVVSSNEGVRKPQEHIFNRARELLEADKYIMVSHLLRDDIIAARRADFEAIWISEKEPEQGLPEDVATRVGSFEELPRAVEDICS